MWSVKTASTTQLCLWGEDMADFSSGVSGYIVGEATVKVFFPKDLKGRENVCCCQCEYYSRTGKTCMLNKKIVAYPEHYIGQNCPLKFEDMETENSENSQSVETTENKNQKTWEAGVF